MKLNSWLHEHPVMAMSFTAIISTMIATYTIMSLLGEPPDLIDTLAIVCVTSGITMMYFGRRRMDVVKKRSLLGLLILALAVPAKADEPLPAQPLPLVIAGGALILVVGGFIGCRAAKQCAKIANARTNSWPDELLADESGAWFGEPETGSCGIERLLPVIPTTVHLSISVAPGPLLQTSIRAEYGWKFSQTYEELQREAQGHGLLIKDGPSAESCYERNRLPCAEEDAGISYDRDRRIIKIGEGGVLVTVERSEDLVAWETFLRIEVGDDAQIAVDDVGGPAMNYRVTSQRR